MVKTISLLILSTAMAAVAAVAPALPASIYLVSAIILGLAGVNCGLRTNLSSFNAKYKEVTQ